MNDKGTNGPGGWHYRRTQRAQLLRFAGGSSRPEGFGYLDDDGAVDVSRPVELYITCRMTHVFGLGALAGEPPAEGGPSLEMLRELASHGVTSLLDGPLRDGTHGGLVRCGAPRHGDRVEQTGLRPRVRGARSEHRRPGRHTSR